MNLIIPFTKDIKFKTSISEIISISLEHEYTVNTEEILGNFIVTGEYKTHEVSINKEKFEYVLPFSVNTTKEIDSDSVDFAIEDFTYEIVDKDILKVNIEYSVKAMEIPKEEIFEPVEETRETFEEMLDSIDEEMSEKEENREEIEEEKEDINEITQDENNTILENINSNEETFITYHIHIMKENDTIESVCTKYNTTTNILGEYNDLSTVAIGDKLIIPEVNE